MFVDSLIEYNDKSSQSCFVIECGVVNTIQSCDPISYEHVPLWSWLFDLHQTT